MSDDELREAQRLVAATRDCKSTVRYMALVCRAGQLALEDLRIASACGCTCSALALGESSDPSREPEALFQRVFKAGGRWAVCSLMVTLARDAWQGLGGVAPDAIGASQALQAALDVIGSPSEANASIATSVSYEMTAFGSNPDASAIEAGGLSFYAAWEAALAYRLPHAQPSNHLKHFLRSLHLVYGGPTEVDNAVTNSCAVLVRQKLGVLPVCNDCPATQAPTAPRL